MFIFVVAIADDFSLIMGDSSGGSVREWDSGVSARDWDPQVCIFKWWKRAGMEERCVRLGPSGMYIQGTEVCGNGKAKFALLFSIIFTSSTS
jgi:hypothetical protein